MLKKHSIRFPPKMLNTFNLVLEFELLSEWFKVALKIE